MARYLSIDLSVLNADEFIKLRNTVPKAMLIVPDGTSAKHLLPLTLGKPASAFGVVFLSFTAPLSNAPTTKVELGTWDQHYEFWKRYDHR